jgi:hypothetical protein
MSRNAVIAEAIRELAEGQEEINEKAGELIAKVDAQHKLLEDIKRILSTTVDGHNEHRAHVTDAMDRLGKRVLKVENRIAAVENDVSPD